MWFTGSRRFLENKLLITDTEEVSRNSRYMCQLEIDAFPRCIQIPRIPGGMTEKNLEIGTFYIIHMFRKWNKRVLILINQISDGKFLLFQGETPTVDVERSFGSSNPLNLYPIYYDPAFKDFYIFYKDDLFSFYRLPVPRPDFLLKTCKLAEIYKLVQHYNLMPVDVAALYTPTEEFILTKFAKNRREQLSECINSSATSRWMRPYEQLKWYTYV